MRFCLVYDCLYPHTVGGAERWYRVLARELVAAGHDVTYLTRRQWKREERPEAPDGVRVVAVSRAGPLYDDDGRRRTLPPLEFGAGVARHLATRRRAYDVVHTGSFPYFSVLGAAGALAGTRTQFGVDWIEAWPRAYWRAYAGPVTGTIGARVQQAAIRVTGHAFVFSALTARRLTDLGLRTPATRLPGLYHGEAVAVPPGEREPLVVFAGRHIADKRAHLVPEIVRAARARVPGLRGLVLGDGPQRPRVLDAIAAAGMDGVVEAPGFVSADAVHQALARATCHLLPSEREGYGMVVIEAAATSTPTVLVREPESAAVELVDDGVNGIVADDVAALAGAVVDVHAAGVTLRESTARWYAEHAAGMTAQASARVVEQTYAR